MIGPAEITDMMADWADRENATADDADEAAALSRAKLNFANKCHGERVWDELTAEVGTGVPSRPFHLCDLEREEFLEQARHEIRTSHGDTLRPKGYAAQHVLSKEGLSGPHLSSHPNLDRRTL